ncbi:hypothetical protein PDE_07678 [Penicillium oxalicum 114-2]|uniref:Uncharacterized protein n=1 Tax=Penicillium oxalicum (strain 114-2 / CGMCC 5302) TaxID=933388 RepID=S8B1M3_PENO1|nr:hypothetical protein PDE_07678 [Penicillium oxalicum 114-2]
MVVRKRISGSNGPGSLDFIPQTCPHDFSAYTQPSAHVGRVDEFARGSRTDGYQAPETPEIAADELHARRAPSGGQLWDNYGTRARATRETGIVATGSAGLGNLPRVQGQNQSLGIVEQSRGKITQMEPVREEESSPKNAELGETWQVWAPPMFYVRKCISLHTIKLSLEGTCGVLQGLAERAGSGSNTDPRFL